MLYLNLWYLFFNRSPTSSRSRSRSRSRSPRHRQHSPPLKKKSSPIKRESPENRPLNPGPVEGGGLGWVKYIYATFICCSTVIHRKGAWLVGVVN